MNIFKKSLLLVALGSVVFGAITYGNPARSNTALNPDKNLFSWNMLNKTISFVDPAKVWRRRAVGDVSIANGTVSVAVKPEQESARVILDFDISTMLIKEAVLTFDYTLEGNASLKYKNASYSIVSGENRTFKQTFAITPVSYGGGIVFSCNKAGSRLVMKNIVLKPVRYDASFLKPILLAGTQAQKICYIKTNLKDTFFDKRAADILQKNLYLAGAGVLPIDEIEKNQKIAGAIMVGQAAKKYIPAKTMKSVEEGGYALVVKRGIAAIYGRHPSGNPAGVFAFLKKLGFFHLTTKEYIVPKDDTLVLGKIKEYSNPAIPMRLDNWPAGNSMGIGMCDPYYMVDMTLLGKSTRAWCHSMINIIPWKEFNESDIEFFAMQKDGVRRTTERGDVHYCFTNKKLQNMTCDRVRELLKSNPTSEYLYLHPGDGGNCECRCDECKKLGNTTDRTIYFVNIVARAIAEEYPNAKLMLLSYTDTRFAPEKFMPEPNVKVLICPYAPVWNNHLITHHEDNEMGLALLNQWLELTPDNLGAFVYPSSCPERLNMWPAFYANYEKYKLFAENKFNFLTYCGLSPNYGPNGSIPGSGIFNPAHRYVMTKVLWNPKLDFEYEIDAFFSHYYGEAAPALREFFDLIHKEVKDRNWSQNTEKVVRGFVTQELADKGMALFAEAEKAVEDNSVIFDRVQREKVYLLWSYLSDVNRTNGKLKPDDFSEYAARLAEFCKLGKKFNVLNLGRGTIHDWFWNSSMIKIPKQGRWYSSAIVKELIEDPEGTLGKNIPKVQMKTDYGYMIPAKGMFGGRVLASCGWLREKPVFARQLYRPSSGNGMVQMILSLKELPVEEVIMKIKGIDNEKESPALMRIVINGENVFEGKVPWKKDKWSYEAFNIPASVFKNGDNTIQILNITPDKDVFSQGRKVQKNYYWGWYMIEECQYICITGCGVKCMEGGIGDR